MPRLTRAQLRAQEAEGGPQHIHEDPDVVETTDSQEYDPFSTEHSSRPPLGEIHANNTSALEAQTEQSPSASKKGSQKSKGSKRNKFNLVLANNENILPDSAQEILEDESQSDASSAADVAAEELRKDVPVSNTFQVTMDTAEPSTPSSAAAKAASRSLSRSPETRLIAVHGSAVKTPRFDPVVHVESPSVSRKEGDKSEDSFVESIKSRTPGKMMHSQEPAGDGPDSFVEDIISRSPSKYAARIEDSVLAMDTLEEAIEQISEELPQIIPEEIESPSQTSSKQTVPESKALAKKTTKTPTSATRLTSRTRLSGPDRATSRPVARRISSIRSDVRHPSALNETKRLSTSKRLTSADTAKPAHQAASTNTAAKRTSLSTSKPGFVPAKSAKPPTISNFSLPGEAIAAKMKAQREERQKKEEAEAEAARKRTEFKARPVPKSVSGVGGKARISSVLPRETATSRARMSLMAAKAGGKENDKNAEAAPAKKLISGSAASLKAGRSEPRKSIAPSTTQSGLSVAKTRTGPRAASSAAPAGAAKKSTVPANSSAVRKNTTNYPAPSKNRQSCVRPTVSPLRVGSGSEAPSSNIKPTTTTAKRTNKGKEVFSRGKIAEEELLRQKREKEAAARKARAEAAERGRLASREWAEKQRKKKGLVETTAQEGKVGDVKKSVGIVG